MIKDCLSAAGITTVVWIDDFFSAPSRDDLAGLIHKHLIVLKEKGQKNIHVQELVSVDLSKTKGEIEEATDGLLENLTDQQMVSVENALANACGTVQSSPPVQPDLTPDQFTTLQSAFGRVLHIYSLTRWTSEGVTKFTSANESTLFLIDKEFSREPGSTDGTEILGQLVTGTTAFCIVLTHQCKESDQDSRRLEIATEKKLQPHRFCVLSKQQCSDEAIDLRFAKAIYAVMTHRFTGDIAATFQAAISEAVKKTAQELARQSVSDLDRALFENSYGEGVLEFDVLRRIFNIEQRYAVNKALQDPVLQKRLLAARKFRQGTGQLRATYSPSTDMAAFREWRKREVFEEGEGLNQTHSPIACGDVFETLGAKPAKYVLLAQPCDLMVRENAKRNADVGLFVLVSEDIPKPEANTQNKASDAARKEERTTSRYFDITGVFGAKQKWRIDFKNTWVVDLFVIDFAVFNPDGHVQLSRVHVEPPIVLANGWLKRLKKAKERIFEKENPPPPLGMGRQATTFQPSLENEWLRYPLRRIGRLESNTASAILAGWATFQTRAALEHDFAQAQIPEETPLLPNIDV